NRITEEAYRITQMAFWKPDPQQPENIVRTGMPADDPTGVSEFPHLIVNQARVLDYFTEAAYQAPTRLEPDYGYEFVTLHNTNEGEYPVSVTLRDSSGPQQGSERTVHAKYVIGCDGAHSRVRDAIGRELTGDDAKHAWGVMD